jgi:hypothetical protein
MSVAYRTTRPHPARPGKGHLHSRVLDTLRRHSAPQPDRSREHPEMLRLDVVSITAAVAGHESGTTWRGEVALSDLRRYLPPGAPMTRERMNGAIYRFFSGAEQQDIARLEAIGYRLPPLTAGDLVTVQTITFLVTESAFERVTHNQSFAGFLLGRSPQS